MPLPDAAAMAPQPGKPFLTIAIPTFRRAETLRETLAMLLPQAAELRDSVDVLIADNCSDDATAEVTAEFTGHFHAAGVRFAAVRHPENIGSDRNFVWVYHHAQGRYLWICADDDLILPGGLREVLTELRAQEPDLLYVTSFGFHDDPLAERVRDPMGRTRHTIHDGVQFARVVNVMFTFISGLVIDRDRLQTVPHEDPAAFVGTNLTQLAWTLPLLRELRTGVVLWTRPLAARVGQMHGYSVGDVFALRFAENVRRLLPGRPDLQAPLLNMTVRRWFPGTLLEARESGNQTVSLETAEQPLRHVFGRNWRFWLFTWPVLRLPLGAARLWVKAGIAVSKGIYTLRVPGFWRKRT